MHFLAIVMSVFLTTLAVGVKTPAVSVSAYPYVGHAPQDVRVTTVVDRHESNRGVCVSLDGPMYTSGCWQLDGTSAPRTFTRYFTGLIEGTYTLQAVVMRSGQDSLVSTPHTILIAP